MKNSPEIIKELMAISPLLGGLEKVNVFSVPEGYFNELHFRITNYAILSSTENINKRNIQEIPKGYFDTLSDSILAKVKAIYIESAEDELRNLSSILFNLKDKNVFKVPTEYFDNLSNSVIAKVNTSNPESAEDELRNLSPVLYNLRDENVFTVPADYFNSLAENVSEKLIPAPAKVITMKKRTSWLKYAAAAIIAGIITITSFQLFKGSSHNGLALLPSYFKESYQYKTEAELDAGIAKLDDADIAKYLEKNGNVLDNVLLITNTDESSMPSSTDYLNDENTLNEYLDKIDAQNSSKLTP